MESFNQDTLRRIRDDDPTLKVLRISDIATPNPNHGDVGAYVPGDGAEFAKLGDIGKCTYLESLCIDGEQQGLDDVITRAFYNGIQCNTSIRRLYLCRCDLSQEGLARNILETFGSHTASVGDNLVGISLQRCILGNGGMNALAPTLRRCKNVEYIRVTESRGNLRLHDELPFFLLNHVVDETLPELVLAIKGHRKLRELDLGQNDVVGSDSCEVLAAGLLRDPDCNLVTLRLENNLLDGKCATVLADALTANTKLENLYLHGNPIFGSELLDDAFSKALCDASSINATYRSNHTLQSLVSFRNWSVPPYLELNRGGDARRIAMRKILRCHPFIDVEPFFEWDMKVLPVAVAWFETARECAEDVAAVDKGKLNTIYQYVFAMPMMFVPAPVGAGVAGKRKKARH